MGRLAAALAVATLALAVAASAAQATKYFDSFFGATGSGATATGGLLSSPRDMAVNGPSAPVQPQDGWIYIVDQVNHRVQAFDAAHNFRFAIGRDVIKPTATTDVNLGDVFEKCTTAADCKAGSAGTTTDGPAGEFDDPQGIDVNQTTGHFYVRDRDNRRVQEFTPDGAFVRMWGWDVITSGPNSNGVAFEVCDTTTGPANALADCKQGVTGNGAGQFATTSYTGGGIAVAPVDAPNAGDVYAVDPGSTAANRRVLQFTSTGAFVRAISGTEGVNNPSSSQPAHVAVDANGVVYATNQNGGSNGSMVLRFDAAESVPLAPIGNGGISFPGGLGAINSLEVDPASDHLLIGRVSALGIMEFDLTDKPEAVDDSDLVDSHAVGLGATPNGIGVSPGAGEYLVSVSSGGLASTGTGNRILVLDGNGVDPPPTVDLLPPTNVGSTTATLQAEINPNGPTGFATNYRFEVSKDGVSWVPVAADQLVGATGDGGVPVFIDDAGTGLEPNTLYRVRVVTTRNPAAGVALSAELIFQTDPAPPEAATIAAQHVSDTSAQLVGRVNPGGLATSYWFEWGDQNYGHTIPAPAATAGSGSVAKTVAASLGGLEAERVYHFRLCAQNALAPAKVCGADATFTTRATLTVSEGRAYEMVTSPDKVLRRGGGHGSVDSDTDYMRLAQGLPSFDGDSLLWGIYAGISDPASGNAFSYDYGFEVRRRAPTGWTGEATVNIAPPTAASSSTNVLGGVSPDLDTQDWAMRTSLFSTGAQAATRVMGDDGGPRGAGWYPWLDLAWLDGNILEDFDRFSYIDDQGERLVGWNNATNNHHRGITGVEDTLPPSGLTPPQTAGTALFLSDPEHDWAPTDLVNECTGTGGGATSIPSRNDSGTDPGPAGTWNFYASFASNSAEVRIDFLNSGTPAVGHTISGQGIQADISPDPGIQPTTIVAVSVGPVGTGSTITISAPTTEAVAQDNFDPAHILTGGQNAAALVDDTIAARVCGEGSPTDTRGAVLGARSGDGRFAGASTLAMSDAGDRIFMMSPDPGVAGAGQVSCAGAFGGATACPAQLFVRQYDDDGNPTVRWISRAEDALFDAPQRIGLFGNGAAFEGASRDGSVVYFRTNAPLTIDDPNGVKDINGDVVAPPPGGIVSGTASPVSWDLYRYELPADNNQDPTGPAAGGLTRISGGPGGTADPNTNCAFAGPICGGEGNGAGASVRFMSDDGQRVYFVTAATIPGAANQPPAGGVTAPAGDHAQANAASRNLYLYDAAKSGDDAYEFVARVPYASTPLDSCASSNPSGGVSARRAADNAGVRASLRPTGGSCVHGTSSGDAIVFETTAQLTSDDVDTAGDVYLYDAAGDTLTRLSAPPADGEAYVCLTTNESVPTVYCNGDLGIGTVAASGAQAGVPPGSTVGQAGMRHHNIAENADGSFKAVYFESRNPLVDGDVNGDRMDVYEWRLDGRLKLLSFGDGSSSAFFTGSSRDGRDVFFWTEQRISPWEIDVADGDVYDARAGGGLPDPVSPPAVCAVLAGACQGGGAGLVTTSPATPDGSSDDNARAGDRKALSIAGLGAQARRRAAASGVLALHVRATAAGRLSLVARGRVGGRGRVLARASKDVSGPGMTTVGLKLSAVARGALRRGAVLRVSVEARQAGARARAITVSLKRGPRR